jgi:hypothetical protein
MNLILQRASHNVTVILERTGVPDAMHDIFNVRMVRIRTKLLKLFTTVQDIQRSLEQLGLLKSSNESGDNNRGNPVAVLADTAKSFTSRFGFGK